jgi:energy-coupling factor transporter ATP-binding protein EcfA2
MIPSAVVGVLFMMVLAPPERPLVVVFGRPGSGKSTIADAATGLLTDEGRSILRLDLDVCVPQWMKDNFANGIYPVRRPEC